MKIGLALSGGGIRGIAHAGVIKALEENNIKIDVIGGSSSGSMVTALYAMGYKPEEILGLLNKYAKTIVKLNKNIIRREVTNFILRRKIISKGINDGEYIERIFNDVAFLKNIRFINELEIPIIITAVDIRSGMENIFTSVEINKENYISDIEISKAVRASSAFPIIYSPMEYKEKIFLDGGILDNIPVKEVKNIGADKIIAVKFDSDRVNKISNAVDIGMKVADIMGAKIAEENLEEADYIIDVPTDGTSIMDIEKIDFCYESGYRTTIKQMDKIKEMLNRNF